MTPITRLSAAMHNRVNGDAPMLRLPSIVNDEREPTEDVAPNLRNFSDAPARRSGDQISDCGLHCRDEGVRNSGRSLPEVEIGGLRILEESFRMKTVNDGHQLAARADSTIRRTWARASSPGISATSPDSTSAIRRRTSAIWASAISDGTS